MLMFGFSMSLHFDDPATCFILMYVEMSIYLVLIELISPCTAVLKNTSKQKHPYSSKSIPPAANIWNA